MEMNEAISSGDASSSKVTVKVPKRILHFSDGTLEEYSDDEIDANESNDTGETPIDPKTLSWSQWLAYKAWTAGNGTLGVVDYVGESLASFFGITTPKYQYEIDEYNRLEEEKKKREDESKGWVASDTESLTTDQPAASV